MIPLRQLWVDLDGTLIDVHEWRARIDLSARFIQWWGPFAPAHKVLLGLHQAQKTLKLAPGVGDEHRALNQDRVIDVFSRAIGMEPSRVSELLDPCLKEVFPKIKKYFYPVPGAVSFIHWAYSQYPLVLATNPVWPAPMVEMRVNWAGLELGHFQSFTHASRMRVCKPHLSYYQELLEQEGVSPKEVIHVGNELKNDGAAIHCGISTYILSKEEGAARCVSPRSEKKGALWMGTLSGLRMLLETEDRL